MADVFSKQKRSEIMAAIRSRGNKETESRLVAMLRRHTIRGWRRHLAIEGKPDFTFPKSRLVIFVDGCFWHGCPKHFRLPSSNEPYWTTKISRNLARDQRVARNLRNEGWKVLRVWQHDLKNETKLIQRIKRALYAGELKQAAKAHKQMNCGRNGQIP